MVLGLGFLPVFQGAAAPAADPDMALGILVPGAVALMIIRPVHVRTVVTQRVRLPALAAAACLLLKTYTNIYVR